MKLAITIILLLTLSLAVPPLAGASGFQSVGGEFGRAWINNFLAQNQKPPEEDLKNNLWNWGTAPKGKKLVGGKLVDAVSDTTVKVNATNWLGDTRYWANPIYLNGTSPYGNYAGSASGGMPLSPLFLSDDPWVLAQQLERPVLTPDGSAYT
jgi:hypothetical protein